eukprot:365245-Chlamydomonas_euryale.AAC.7
MAAMLPARRERRGVFQRSAASGPAAACGGIAPWRSPSQCFLPVLAACKKIDANTRRGRAPRPAARSSPSGCRRRGAPPKSMPRRVSERPRPRLPPPCAARRWLRAARRSLCREEGGVPSSMRAGLHPA